MDLEDGRFSLHTASSSNKAPGLGRQDMKTVPKAGGSAPEETPNTNASKKQKQTSGQKVTATATSTRKPRGGNRGWVCS